MTPSSVPLTEQELAEAVELAEWITGVRDSYSPARPDPHEREEVLARALLASRACLVSAQEALRQGDAWLDGLEQTLIAEGACENEDVADDGTREGNTCIACEDELEYPDDFCQWCYRLTCVREARAVLAGTAERQEPQTPNEDAYFLERGEDFASAIGVARLHLKRGNPEKALEALDGAVNESSRKHVAACIADGAEPDVAEFIFGGQIPVAGSAEPPAKPEEETT